MFLLRPTCTRGSNYGDTYKQKNKSLDHKNLLMLTCRSLPDGGVRCMAVELCHLTTMGCLSILSISIVPKTISKKNERISYIERLM